MKRFVLTGPAQRDLDEIRNYLLDKAGPRITRRVLQTIRRSIELIASQPGIGHVRRDLTGRSLKFWPVYSYLIVYNPEPIPTEIIRILHGNRDIETILN